MHVLALLFRGLGPDVIGYVASAGFDVAHILLTLIPLSFACCAMRDVHVFPRLHPFYAARRAQTPFPCTRSRFIFFKITRNFP